MLRQLLHAHTNHRTNGKLYSTVSDYIIIVSIGRYAHNII